MSTTFDGLSDDVLLTLQGFGLSQPRASVLNMAVSTTDTVFTLADVSGFEQGIAEIGDEVLFITNVDRDGSTITVSRAQYGTTAAAYPVGEAVTMAPVWTRKRVKAAINEAIVGVYPTLWGTASTTFTFNPAVTTYSLPAEAEKVISVHTDTIGPSKEFLQIHRYSENLNVPTGSFATGKTITLEKGGFPGRDIVVVYRKAPSELVNGSDLFTLSGLRETAKVCVKYAACSILTAFMDAARLPVDTAQADAYDPSKDPVGNATKISAQLYQRYQIELGQEQRRLLQTTPATLSVRTR